MKVQWDELKVGMYVAVTAYKGEEQTTPWGHTYKPTIQFDGEPLKILAKSMPFVSVTDGHKVYAIDWRSWDIQKLSPHYVRAMLVNRQGCQSVTASELMETTGQRRKRKHKNKYTGPSVCPRCGGNRGQGEGVWRWYCPDCGLEEEMAKL